MKWCKLDTPLGRAAILFGEHGIRRIFLPPVTEEDIRPFWEPGTPELEPADCPEARAMLRYFQGELEPLDFAIEYGEATAFQRQVFDALRKIPYGETRTYSEVAKAVGSPRGARAVGTAVAQNPLPLVIPCHRVLAAKGRLGGFSARGGVALKQKLLDLEARA